MIILANRIFAFSYGNEILNLFEIDAGSLFNERPPPPPFEGMRNFHQPLPPKKNKKHNKNSNNEREGSIFKPSLWKFRRYCSFQKCLKLMEFPWNVKKWKRSSRG
jgi:hypothetical protein